MQLLDSGPIRAPFRWRGATGPGIPDSASGRARPFWLSRLRGRRRTRSCPWPLVHISACRPLRVRLLAG